MKNILVPYDFNSQSVRALDQAIHLAQKTHSNVTLLYVHELPGFVSALFKEHQDEELLEKISEELETVAAKISFKSGINTDIRIQQGRTFSTIVEVADELMADFIVIGTRSKDSLIDNTKPMVGRNTSRVIRMAGCPVITVGGTNHYNGCRAILLPLDLTKETRQKIGMAIKMAKIYDAQIKAVSALWSTHNPEIRSKLELQMLHVKNTIEMAGLKCCTQMIETPSGAKTSVPAILDYACNEKDIDLIVVMTQQESSLVEFFIGSHAQEFIRLSEIPVMSVIPKESHNDNG